MVNAPRWFILYGNDQWMPEGAAWYTAERSSGLIGRQWSLKVKNAEGSDDLKGTDDLLNSWKEMWAMKERFSFVNIEAPETSESDLTLPHLERILFLIKLCMSEGPWQTR